ncbi:hypothetical protein [Paractinoplanes globisporus]|uniref:Class I SAM-dependent methyltransferase n=1 Tax=Paractinoplanes globisporus TaxID=113565 RepID=A0ABW6W7S3_9ACTN|nr:hypothetical protein [Actinoplanes globisporus]
MTDSVLYVRGEIQPWTDYAGHRAPAGGAPLLALLDDLLPDPGSRTLVVGPHSPELIELAASRTGALTVLVRSVSDARDLRAAVPSPTVTVITGALDGLAGAPPYDVVIAADGLDRVLGADSPALDWPARLALLSALATEDAVVLVAVANEFALTGLYDRRPVGERHGDDEWRPLHDDPARPTSPAQVAAALGPRLSRLYATFDAAGLSHTLLDAAAAAATRPGRPAARLAAEALAVTAAHTPLLAPVADGADAAARAGLLAAVAPGWLALLGSGGATHTAYAPAGSPSAGGVLLADLDESGWTLSVRGQAAAVPASRLPDTESAETLLFRLAAAENVPGFRAIAARLGAWAGLADGLVLLDDLYPDGDDFARGLTHPAGGEDAPAILAAAYHRLRDRLVRAHRRHPWPPWMVDSDDLVTTWLGMSGIADNAVAVKRGREIADGLAAPRAGEPDLRTVLAGAEDDRRRAADLAGKVFGLERTLGFRDQSLRTREQEIRALREELRTTAEELRATRGELRTATAELLRLHALPVMRLHSVTRKVAKVRYPRQFARAIKHRLRKG